MTTQHRDALMRFSLGLGILAGALLAVSVSLWFALVFGGGVMLWGAWGWEE